VLPAFDGQPVRVEIRASLGAHAAASSIPRRFILLDSSVLSRTGEFERILIHELFHFAWVHLSNRARRSWEAVLQQEIRAKIPGELGWSAEWRKAKLRLLDARLRTPAWRRYACESFCDTAAWLYCGLRAHDEFTLGRSGRPARRAWFANLAKTGFRI
jgi:hypothetical protein